jgi:ADP-ribose 1''-phosphate phosphatase
MVGIVTHVKGDLFDGAPDDALLVHACNAQGVWGGYQGIATQFKKRFPVAFVDYAHWCSQKDRTGEALISGRVGCLVTSRGYGRRADPPYDIIRNTGFAIKMLMPILGEFTEIHSPRINSGLFRVPWAYTESLIWRAIKGKPVNWTVWGL